MENCYCSVVFKTGEELDEALLKAKTACDEAEKAVKAREAIENMKVEGVPLSAGKVPTVVKTVENGVAKLTFGLVPGEKGDKGDAFTYEDFTEEQLIALKGDPFTYEDFTEEQLEALRGPKGEAFTYADFTAEQLEALRGPAGSSIRSIERTSGTGAAGAVDIYTITLTDGTTATFSVYNGKDGEGAGDMTAAVYDPQGKKTDVFKYVDDAVGSLDVEVTADEVTFADGDTFQQKYNNGELTGPAGKDGAAGADGKDGVSATHSWDGTKLTITSASGTSSADLKGEKGDKGDTGATGGTGAAGADATINGVNALTLTTGTGLSGSQSGSTYTLSLASHNQAASTITAGTFAGQVVANSAGQTEGTALLRNSKLVSADTTPTNNGEICWTYK